MTFILLKTIFLCLISQSHTSLTKYDTISNYVMQTEGEGEFFLNIKSDLYSLDITRLELIKDPDDLIFDSSDNDAVVGRDDNILNAFGYIKENRFYGQFQSSGRTFFIDDANKVGQTGKNAILYSLEDVFVAQASSVSRQDSERTVEKDPDSPQRVIDRQLNYLTFKDGVQIIGALWVFVSF